MSTGGKNMDGTIIAEKMIAEEELEEGYRIFHVARGLLATIAMIFLVICALSVVIKTAIDLRHNAKLVFEQNNLAN